MSFSGQKTAGITHEIKNVLAIIQESSGLMEDILAITPDETFPRKDKFNTSLKRIFGQIDRGVDITTRLNKFAHSPDHSPTDVDLNEVSEQMVLLASRFARLKNVVIEADPHDAPMIIHTHPVALEMALFESIEILLNALNSGGKIRLYPRKIQDRYVFGVCYEGTIPSQAELFRRRFLPLNAGNHCKKQWRTWAEPQKPLILRWKSCYISPIRKYIKRPKRFHNASLERFQKVSIVPLPSLIIL